MQTLQYRSSVRSKHQVLSPYLASSAKSSRVAEVCYPHTWRRARTLAHALTAWTSPSCSSPSCRRGCSSSARQQCSARSRSPATVLRVQPATAPASRTCAAAAPRVRPAEEQPRGRHHHRRPSWSRVRSRFGAAMPGSRRERQWRARGEGAWRERHREKEGGERI